MKPIVLTTLIVAVNMNAFAASEISLQSAPPVVVKSVPAAGATDVDPALTEIRVTYSKAMRDGGWAWATWGEENFPKTTGQPHYETDGRTCVLPVKLEPGKFYATWLNSGILKDFVDTNGQPAVPYLLTFRTAAPGAGVAGSPGFGPVMEAVLKSPEGRVAELFDLDSGQRATSTTFGENDRETHAWVRVHNLDLLGVVEKGQIAVLCHDMAVLPVKSERWEQATPPDILADKMLAQMEPNKITAVSPAIDKTDTWFFRTRENGHGILQIVGASENPRGVKIRYKLVQKSSGGGSVVTTTVVERQVNKLVSEFPEPPDFSTPENTFAAWQRANARRDTQAISRLSVMPTDPADEENWFRREAARDPEGLDVYLKALADSQILVVQTWRDDLASVVGFLPFPPGKGRHPYNARVFGRVDGQWKNIGEDRLPDLESAKANFEQKKTALWNHFMELKTRLAELSAAPAEKAEWMGRVENFFQHNFRDITARDSLEWGDVSRADDGKVSIRYQYRAKIWDKDTITNDQVFTFDRAGKFISVKDARPNAGAPGQSR